jgi:hypothetical protein
MDPLDALVASLMGPVGVLPGFIVALDPIETPDRLPRIAPNPLDRFESPDAPPPRA